MRDKQIERIHFIVHHKKTTVLQHHLICVYNSGLTADSDILQTTLMESTTLLLTKFTYCNHPCGCYWGQRYTGLSCADYLACCVDVGGQVDNNWWAITAVIDRCMCC